jgi:hypothetical protein
MASYSPELIQTMRAALDEVMTKLKSHWSRQRRELRRPWLNHKSGKARGLGHLHRTPGGANDQDERGRHPQGCR